jgi:hypothetical protein
MSDHHPPVIMIWDGVLAQYVEASGRVCCAQWKSAGRDHAAGDLCGRKVYRKVGDVPMCRHHCERAWNAGHPWREEAVADLHREWAADRERQETARRATDREARRRRRRADGHIYYARRTSDGLIKIGTSQSIQRRLGVLRGTYGEMDLLLVHGGGMDREDEIHRIFDAWQSRGEWFHPGRPLLEWILRHRRDWGVRSEQLPGTVPIGALEELLAGSSRTPPARQYVPPKRRAS